MTQPLVSIVIPTFNMKDYLLPTLHNCCEQSYPNIEIVVADDGSTDGTEELLRKFYSLRPIVYCKQNNSGGPASPRNLGIKYSSGKYIQFLDADDLLDREMTKTLVEMLEKETVGGGDIVAYCDWRFYRTDKNDKAILERRGPVHGEYWPNSFTMQFNLYTIVHRFVYPRKILDKYGYFDETMKHTEDLDLWTRLIIHGVKFLYCSKPMAFYRERHGHSMTNPIPQAQGKLQAIRKAREYMLETGVYENYRDELCELEAHWEANIKKLITAE